VVFAFRFVRNRHRRAVIESDAQARRITAHLLDDQRNIDGRLANHETSGI